MKSFSKKLNKSFNLFSIIGLVLLLLYTISLLIPIAWAVMTSFKTRLEFIDNPFSLPQKFNLSNYTTAFDRLFVTIEAGRGSRKVYLEELFLNSFIYSLVCTFMATATPCITAYAVAKYKHTIPAKIIYVIAIVTFIVPIIGNLPSEIRMLKVLNLYDTMLGIAFLRGNFLGLYFFIFYSAFVAFANDYDEAARIDGASSLRIMLQINLPLMRTTIMAVAVLRFVVFWNEYTTPMIFLPNTPTVSYGLYKFKYSTDVRINSIPSLMSACLLVFVPIFVFFLIFKNAIMGNIAIGGIKG